MTDSVSHAAISGICVWALDSSGHDLLAAALTSASGAYTLCGLSTGSDKVEFFTGFFANCSVVNYVTQYYNNKSSAASANAVAVTDGSTTSGINAAMVKAGRITGKVTDSISHAAASGICVSALTSSGIFVASTTTNASGVYSLSGLPSGPDKVQFSAGCGGSVSYATQFYNDKTSFATATPVAVTAGATKSGINAAMVRIGQITGKVTDSVSHAAISGICVYAHESSNGNFVASTSTDSSGVYTLSGLPSGPEKIEFFTGCGGAGSYLTQFYNDKSSLATANAVAVTAGTTTSGINAAMVRGGQIKGKVTDSISHAAISGICVYAYEYSTGSFLGSTATNASGLYALSGLPSGPEKVQFSTGCGAGNYTTQYYNYKSSFAAANAVAVNAGATTSGINAAMT